MWIPHFIQHLTRYPSTQQLPKNKCINQCLKNNLSETKGQIFGPVVNRGRDATTHQGVWVLVLAPLPTPANAYPGRQWHRLKCLGPCSPCGRPRASSVPLASDWLHAGCCEPLKNELIDGNCLSLSSDSPIKTKKKQTRNASPLI